MSSQLDDFPPEASWQEEFVRLLGMNQGRVFAYIITLLPNRADAEDVLQQTSLILFRKFAEDYDRERDFVPWACGVAHHVALNHLKKLRRDRHVFAAELLEQIGQEQIERRPLLDQRHDALRACLAKLTAADRRIVQQYYEAGKTTAKEVAQLLGRPVNTILKALIRIRGNLHRCIDRALAREGRP